MGKIDQPQFWPENTPRMPEAKGELTILVRLHALIAEGSDVQEAVQHITNSAIVKIVKALPHLTVLPGAASYEDLKTKEKLAFEYTPKVKTEEPKKPRKEKSDGKAVAKRPKPEGREVPGSEA